MTSVIQRASSTYAQHGLLGFLRRGIGHVIRHVLAILYFGEPFRIGVYNGVAVRNVGLFAKTDRFPDHEAELIDGIRQFVSAGDSVVIVGGGTGPSSVATANRTGAEGTVTVYEASAFSVERLKETIELNEVSDTVEVKHGVVEDAVHVPGETKEAAMFAAEDLPESDTLVLDCEGAELPILQNIASYPDRVIVETHTHFDSSAEQVRQLLTEMGYTVEEEMTRNEQISVIVAEIDK